ncbi:unnamed protein product [Cochlearia groenlandica]
MLHRHDMGEGTETSCWINNCYFEFAGHRDVFMCCHEILGSGDILLRRHELQGPEAGVGITTAKCCGYGQFSRSIARAPGSIKHF